MNIFLESLYNKFKSTITAEDELNPEKDDPNGKYHFYIPKIRDYFLVYIEEQLKSKNYATSIERIRLYFREVFNRESLIEATIFYVENCPTRNLSDKAKEKRANAIRDFLIAYNHFYDVTLKHEYTVNTFQLDNLFPEVCFRLESKGYVILESEQYPAMTKDEYIFILEYYKNLRPLHDKQLQIWIILQLSFLYGLSFSTIRNMKTEDIDIEKRRLRILNKEKTNYIQLELPYSLFKDINTHITENNLDKITFLFFTKNSPSKPIASSFLTDTFNTLKKMYLTQNDYNSYTGNQFTHYGTVKYAITNMIKKNIDLSSIVDLTGRDINFILSCKPEETLKNQSNYINAKLRSTDTFLDFNN